MAEQSLAETETRCARCGDMGTGRFCAGCGAPLRDVACAACNQPLQAGARFCNNCGTAAGGGSAKSGVSDGALAKMVGGAAILMLIAFVGGQMYGRRSGGASGAATEQAGIPLSAATQTAPDISNMSPDERANRLFNRVMAYSEQGKLDSAKFFAPMAIQAYQMIGPLDAHARYDIGEISAAVGETAMARLEADSILATQPKHLLGLVLGIRAAEMGSDTKRVAQLQQRLVSAAPTERAKNVKEYVEHGREIDNALKKAGASP